ncbi:hypothetical protein HY30_00090 [Hyphomonas chukchiensis]|uniref:Uncharacterized protein n=1 Tax=Hyphomonas chukchiensis TaxID=1280947 RepID=A0A062UFQ7_9PROT|nr:hypothetical protein HY30_00090 [Hyphomonas chukchiensis]
MGFAVRCPEQVQHIRIPGESRDLLRVGWKQLREAPAFAGDTDVSRFEVLHSKQC